jgi:hypothetical protein
MAVRTENIPPIASRCKLKFEGTKELGKVSTNGNDQTVELQKEFESWPTCREETADFRLVTTG